MDPGTMQTIGSQAPGVAGVVILVSLFLLYLTPQGQEGRRPPGQSGRS